MLTVDLDRARVRAGSVVLDLGCGGGRHSFACLRAGADVVACDVLESELSVVLATAEAMREAGELGDGVAQTATVGDALSLPFATASFDCVIASEVLEHITDDRAAIAELARVLRPGGFIAISVPRSGPERINWTLSRAYHSVEGGHVRIYRRRELFERLARAELRLCGYHYAHALHSPYWWLRCAVGVDRSDHRLVAAYHRLLVWDIVRRPLVTRVAERVLSPLIGKSLVCYLEKAS